MNDDAEQYCRHDGEPGMTILLVDHNVRRVVKMAEYVVMNLGEITAQSRREEFEGDLHEQVKAWLGASF